MASPVQNDFISAEKGIDWKKTPAVVRLNTLVTALNAIKVTEFTWVGLSPSNPISWMEKPASTHSGCLFGDSVVKNSYKMEKTVDNGIRIS